MPVLFLFNLYDMGIMWGRKTLDFFFLPKLKITVDLISSQSIHGCYTDGP